MKSTTGRERYSWVVQQGLADDPNHGLGLFESVKALELLDWVSFLVLMSCRMMPLSDSRKQNLLVGHDPVFQDSVEDAGDRVGDLPRKTLVFKNGVGALAHIDSERFLEVGLFQPDPLMKGQRRRRAFCGGGRVGGNTLGSRLPPSKISAQGQRNAS